MFVVYIRKMERKWVTKEGEIKFRIYYYKYASRRIGSKVISECLGASNEEEYLLAQNKK